mmetsp:Transcript_103263/g.301228  ORF Transcript_103263/g.301228 Transcript_103263/m.301228 type:complete len:340 (+) Transcript_103263:34-1053(+)
MPAILRCSTFCYFQGLRLQQTRRKCSHQVLPGFHHQLLVEAFEGDGQPAAPGAIRRLVLVRGGVGADGHLGEGPDGLAERREDVDLLRVQLQRGRGPLVRAVESPVGRRALEHRLEGPRHAREDVDVTHGHERPWVAVRQPLHLRTFGHLGHLVPRVAAGGLLLGGVGGAFATATQVLGEHLEEARVLDQRAAERRRHACHGQVVVCGTQAARGKYQLAGVGDAPDAGSDGLDLVRHDLHARHPDAPAVQLLADVPGVGVVHLAAEDLVADDHDARRPGRTHAPGSRHRGLLGRSLRGRCRLRSRLSLLPFALPLLGPVARHPASALQCRILQLARRRI